jgi:DNA-binding NarL/FixJ family response regulator
LNDGIVDPEFGSEPFLIPARRHYAGLLNKQVGSDLGISEITVKAHRGRIMQKMKADSLADLVNMAARLGLARTPKAV